MGRGLNAAARVWSGNQWLCEDTIRELRGSMPRVLETRPRDGGIEATWSDFFCGGGGSMDGLLRVPGAGGALAVNHWLLAIETHNYNFPQIDHDRANLARTDPRRYPTTDLAWFSPECTHWSIARGDKCDYDTEWEQPELLGIDGSDDDPEKPEAPEAKWRSRMLMRDVVRFTRHHRYRAVVVENVPDILKWVNFDRWLGDMHAEGYKHKVLTLNSAFAHAYGEPAPQLRDRVYIVFWNAKYPTPNWDKWLRPQAWCPSCGEVVRGLYTAKPGPRRAMRYRSQYGYRCPKVSCRGAVVQPYVLPALSAIDMSLPTQRIGDRKKPLAPATRARVAAGLARHCVPIVAEVAGHTFERRPGVRTRPVTMPFTTQHTTAAKGLACPPLLVPTGGNWNDEAALATQPLRTRTTRESEAVVTAPFLTVLRSGRPRTIDPGRQPLATVVADGSGHALVDPPLLVPVEARDGQRARPATEPMRAQTSRHQDALVVPLRNNGVATPAATHPLVTLAASGTHHAFVMRNNTARGDQGQMSTPLDEPLRTVLAEQRQSLVDWSHLLYSYDTGALRPLAEPLPAQTTVEGDAVLGASVAVDDCTLRMLAVKEIQAGMAFAPEFVLLGNAKRDKVRMLGNAVTPPASRDLAACVMEAVCGIDYELHDFAQAGW